jgi:hypothetical protein
MSLLRLIAGQRFAAFPSISIPTHCRSSQRGRDLEFPAARFTPLEGFPSSAAAPCHHGRCLPDVPLTPNPAKSPPKSRPTSQHQFPCPPKSPGIRVPRNRSCVSHRPIRVVPEISAEAVLPGLVLAASEEATQPICKQIAAWCISTIGSEEPTLNTSATVLRRVLPSLVNSLPCREAEVPEDRGASTSEDIDLPHDRCVPLERGVQRSQTRVA